LKKPSVLPYEVANSIGNYNALLDCMNKYKDDKHLVEKIKELLKEIKIED
jgi:hypothetical protein